jgi:hypothetical protein
VRLMQTTPRTASCSGAISPAIRSKPVTGAVFKLADRASRASVDQRR